MSSINRYKKKNSIYNANINDYVFLNYPNDRMNQIYMTVHASSDFSLAHSTTFNFSILEAFLDVTSKWGYAGV